MSITHRFIRAVVLCLTVAASATATGQEAPVPADGQTDGMCLANLFPNPSFEEGLTGWSVARGDPQSVAIDKADCHTGGASLCLKPQESPAHVMLVGPRVPVNPYEKCRLHFFAKSDRPPIGPLFRIYPVNTDGRQCAGRSWWLTADGTADWSGVYADMVFPPDVAQVQVTLCGGYWDTSLDRGATIWIDDLQFGPAKELDLGDKTTASDLSIVSNGGFESGYGAQAFAWTANWPPCSFSTLGAFAGGEAQVRWDDEDPYCGERSLCIESQATDPTRQYLVVQTVYPENGQAYDIRFHAKAEGANGRVVFEPYGEDGKWVCTVCGARLKPGGWQEYVLHYVPDERVPTPSGLKISICVKGPGKVWIDELEMVPAGAGFGRTEAGQ